MSGFFGRQSKLMIGTASPPTVGLDFVSDTLSLHRSMANANGLKGTFTDYAARARPSITPVGGQLVLRPTPVDLSTLLTLMGAPTGAAQSDTVTTYNHWAIRGSLIYKFAGVGISRWTLSGRQGEPVLLTLDCVGQTLDATAASSGFPSFSIDTTTVPLMFHELVLTVNSATYQCKSFSLTVDRHIDAGRFFNSQTLVSVQATGRTVTLSHDLPYGDAAAAYQLNQNAGVAASLVLTSGGTSLTAAMPAVQYEDDSPVVPGPDEVMLPLTGTARGSAAGNELVMTLDATP